MLTYSVNMEQMKNANDECYEHHFIFWDIKTNRGWPWNFGKKLIFYEQIHSESYLTSYMKLFSAFHKEEYLKLTLSTLMDHYV